jgi:hypothetical protein
MLRAADSAKGGELPSLNSLQTSSLPRRRRRLVETPGEAGNATEGFARAGPTDLHWSSLYRHVPFPTTPEVRMLGRAR